MGSILRETQDFSSPVGTKCGYCIDFDTHITSLRDSEKRGVGVLPISRPYGTREIPGAVCTPQITPLAGLALREIESIDSNYPAVLKQK